MNNTGYILMFQCEVGKNPGYL